MINLLDVIDEVEEAAAQSVFSPPPARRPARGTMGSADCDGESESIMKKFNTTAVCIPSKHYMVDLSECVAQIKEMVDAGEYFTINRARQYGKTTTITALRKILVEEYSVLSLDFQGIGKAGFSTEENSYRSFAGWFGAEEKQTPKFLTAYCAKS